MDSPCSIRCTRVLAHPRRNPACRARLEGIITKSLFFFSIVLIALMSLDVATTNYALSNGLGYEGNVLMSGVASNLNYLILIKFIGSMVILMLMSKILQKNEKFAKIGMRIIIFMMLFVVGNNLLVISASAADYTYGNVTTINPSYNTDTYPFQFIFTDNGVVSGRGDDVELNAIGYQTTNQRLRNGVDILTLFEDRTISSGSGARVWGTNEAGDVFYFDDNLVNYSAGFYSAPIGGCASVGGNCNPIYKVGVRSAEISTRQIIEDSHGNIYVPDLQAIYKYDSSNEYTESLLFSVDSTNDYQANVCGSGHKILDLAIDTDDNIHMLIGSVVNCAPNGNYYLSKSVRTNTGTFVYADKGLINTGTQSTGTQWIAGGLILDAVNPIYNYTYSSSAIYSGSVYHNLIKHNSTAGTTSILADTTLLTNNIYDLGYSANKLYAAYKNSNFVRTFSTNFTGYTPPPFESGTGNLDLTYETATIESLETTYYNKSDIYLNYIVIISSLNVNNILLDFNDYRWMISMTDPNGVSQDIIQSPACMFDSLLDTTCQVTSSMGIHAPANGWLAGSWSAKLYEINTVTANRALVATSTSFTVLNTSLENQTIIPPPFIPPTSGTAPQAVSKIDGFVSWLGLGVNSVSKLLFAMIIIAIAATVGLGWGNGNIAMVFAFVPFAFFTFIDYIPKWIFIIAIILIAIVSRAFR